MHFWIDKRSVCGQRRPYFVRSPCLYRPKPLLHCTSSMVTPVHRFQRVESMQVEGRRSAEYGRGRSSRGGRRLDPGSHVTIDEEDEATHTQVADTATPSTPREELCLTRLNVPEQTSRRTSANSSLYTRIPIPDNFNRFPVGGINLCVWVWVTFIILTMMLLPAHLYLKNSNYHVAFIGVFFVIILLFLVCFSVSLFHTKTRTILLHRLNLEDEARFGLEGDPASPSHHSPLSFGTTLSHSRPRRHPHFSPIHISASTPDLLVNGQMAVAQGHLSRMDPQSHEPRGVMYGFLRPQETPEHQQAISPASDAGSDPPPYHVAILLPDSPQVPMPRENETPPPAYDNVQ